ncbi:MAG: hypothetical protein WA485_11510, partial [Candidatus Sulfotelmatobacter sp.]
YQKFDIGAMGEFDVALLLEQYAGKAVSKKIYPEWRGGYYYAAKAKTNTAAPLGLLYVSRWSSPESAAEFAALYAQSLKQRYKEANETGQTQLAQGDSRAPDSKAPDTQLKDDSGPTLPHLTGRHTWSTEEGTIVIEEKGETVFVSESLDAATTSTLEREVLSSVP